MKKGTLSNAGILALAVFISGLIFQPVRAEGDAVPAGGAVVFNMTDRGYAPFMIPAVGGKPAGGIILDVLRLILNKRDISVHTLAVPKNRELRYLEAGNLDAHATAREWISNADAFVFTDPVLNIRNVVITKKTSDWRFNDFDDLVGKRLVTHLGFVYPPLSGYFNSGQIRRVDGTSGLSMLKMVRSGRGDGAIMNDAVAMWLISQNGLEDEFILSHRAVTDFGYRIMFAPKWKSLVDYFNMELARLRQTGELAEIFRRYGYMPTGGS